MKKLLLVVLSILSLNAVAEIIGELPNKAGGKIVLLDRQCTTVQNTFVAFSYLPDNRSLIGCWTAAGDRVFIDWNGDIRSYSINDFNFPKKR
jgi:hypothetical protein